MGREDREKLTDVISKSQFLFSKKVDTFHEAYPTIAKLHVEVSEKELGSSGLARRLTFTEQHFQHAVNCSNPVCYRGGVQVGWLIHDMVRNKETDREETKSCEGYEGSPKGRKRYRTCLHRFTVKAHVDYREDASAEQTD
jgi:hypothetical protein